MVFRISFPPMTACVRCGEISRAAIGIPVLCVTVWDAPGLVEMLTDQFLFFFLFFPSQYFVCKGSRKKKVVHDLA